METRSTNETGISGTSRQITVRVLGAQTRNFDFVEIGLIDHMDFIFFGIQQSKAVRQIVQDFVFKLAQSRSIIYEEVSSMLSALKHFFWSGEYIMNSAFVLPLATSLLEPAE